MCDMYEMNVTNVCDLLLHARIAAVVGFWPCKSVPVPIWTTAVCGAAMVGVHLKLFVGRRRFDVDFGSGEAGMKAFGSLLISDEGSLKAAGEVNL